MSRARHKAAGGATPQNEKPKAEYSGSAGKVDEEAEEKKHGGRTKRKSGGKVEGEMAPMNLGRAARKRGGRTGGGGSNRSPLTSAANSANPDGHTPDMTGDASDGERP